MSGHSKWSTIKRAKGANDVKKGATFTKISNAISLAARSGNSGDPDDNPKLRMIVAEARAVNMPKENVQRAIDRGLGKLEGQTLEEVVYEGFGPGKAAFIVEGITDNKNRTNSEVRNIFEKNGGILGSQGSVAYMFDKIGEIKVKSLGKNSDEEILELIDLGAGDVEEYAEDDMQKYLIYTDISELNTMGNKITQAGFEVEKSNIIMKPNIFVDIEDPEIGKKLIEFTQKIEDQEDVQKVYANFNISQLYSK